MILDLLCSCVKICRHWHTAQGDLAFYLEMTMNLKRFEGNPILSPDPAHYREDLAVFLKFNWCNKLEAGDMSLQ